jgi:hypothetical protein
MFPSKLRFAVLIFVSIAIAHRSDAHPPLAANPQNISGDKLSASNTQTNSITLPSGTSITVRMIDDVDSSRNKAGDAFHASLESPLVANDTVVATKGADVFGKLVHVDKNGKIAGAGRLSLALTGIQIKGQLVPISSATYELVGKGRGKQSAERIGGGAAAGATIGGIAGGGAGAAIGAGAGAAGGTLVQLLTHGDHLRVPSESVLEFTLEQPADLPRDDPPVPTTTPTADLPSTAEEMAPVPQPLSSQKEPALAFVPVLASDNRTLAPGFSTKGACDIAGDRVNIHSAGSVSYSFKVASGESMTVAFGTPTGGYLSSAPAEVSLNGVTMGFIEKDPNYVWGQTAPHQLLLWRNTFGPGSHVLTFRSGGEFVNFYGLWSSGPWKASGEAPELSASIPPGNGNAQAQSVTETHISDPLGIRWDENQAGSSAIWTRRGTSNIFDANWENGVVTAVVSVWVQDSNLRMERRNSSDGNDCDYKGTFAPDWATASGTFDCLRWVHGGHWSAKIERPLPLKRSASTGNSGIRSVDFQNLDYPASCLGENGTAGNVHISNGQGDTPDADFRVEKAIFGDLKGDGQEEAVVVVSCHPSGVSPNVVDSQVFVFEMSASGPRILAKLPSSNWSGRRVEEATVSDNGLVVSYLDGECNACKDWVITVRFRWNATQFVRVGQTRKPYKPS